MKNCVAHNRPKCMAIECWESRQKPSNSALSALLSAFTEADIREIDNLDARLKRHGFSWQNTDYITMQDIIPKLKALIDSGI